MNVDQLREILPLKKSRIYYLTHIGAIPHHKVGQTLLFREDEILEWMEGNKVAYMKAHLIRRGKHYAVKFFDAQGGRWSHRSLKATKKAIADRRFGQFLADGHKKELLGEWH